MASITTGQLGNMHRPPPYSPTPSHLHRPSQSSTSPNRRQTMAIALQSLKTMKDGPSGVIALKGSLALAQTATIITLLVVSYHTNSSWEDGDVVQAKVPKGACGKPLERWIVASSVRLMVCWWVSLWIVWRKRGEDVGGINGDAGIVENGQ
jgi:hypothetical protein